jgi:hypothetical protein
MNATYLVSRVTGQVVASTWMSACSSCPFHVALKQPQNCSDAATVHFCIVRLSEAVNSNGDPPGGKRRTPFDLFQEFLPLNRPVRKSSYHSTENRLRILTVPR